jgi:hypothetical protein
MASAIEEHYRTMSIASLGIAVLPKPTPTPYVVKAINEISDIPGAQRRSKFEAFYNKPQFLQSEIEGSTSKQLHWSRNCPDNNLKIDDIPGTRHTVKDRMMRTTRCVNPLQPEYTLPAYVAAEIQPTRFIRDQQDISDIEGSKPRVRILPPPRDNICVADIEGAQPKQT